MYKRSTLKELATALDVSVATVSRALAGYHDISPRTRERVRLKALEIGYVPNSAGRMLVSGRSGFVGLVLPVRGPNFFDSFLGEFVSGLGEGLVACGTDLLIAAAPEGQSELGVLTHLVNSGRADGVVLTRIAEDDERVRFLIERAFPFVTHGRMAFAEAPYSWMDTDGAEAFARAFRMLRALGHRRFGLLTIDEPMGFRRDREAGLERSIRQSADPAVSLAVVRAPRFDAEGHREKLRRLLTSSDRPTALIGLIDELALMAMQDAARLGLSVPGELSVVGFDNVPAAAFATPGLTTFDQATRDSARDIAGMLDTLIRGGANEPLAVLRKAALIERGSHGPAPAG